MSYINVRWAFPTFLWSPTYTQILAASSFIQSEEKHRISRFAFQDDAKCSLIGRLMMRKFVHLSTNIPYEEIHFGRDEHGKPILVGHNEITSYFNISHQGDYVVLAGNTEKEVGIDIMKIVPPPNKDIQEFFRLMKRQLSEHEWNLIRKHSSEMQQIACFYRIWCLKESYVKNIGVGITIPLQNLSFSFKSPLKLGEIITDTNLYENKILKEDWLFEETLLDKDHAVAVSLKKPITMPIKQFEMLDFDELIKEAKPLLDSDNIFAENFIKKELKRF